MKELNIKHQDDEFNNLVKSGLGNQLHMKRSKLKKDFEGEMFCGK